MHSQDLEWWLSRLDDVRATGNGYIAKCPGHEDRVRSFSITERDGQVLFYCFAGCEYQHIVDCMMGTEDPTPDEAKSKTVKISMVSEKTEKITTPDPREWWQAYTCIPATLWESLGVRFESSSIRFTWDSTDVVKTRKAGSKDFFWEGSPIPPLWPSLPNELPSTIFLTEGESDCGALRNVGIPAWSITRGAKSGIPPGAWRVMKERGVHKIFVAFDEDQPGQLGAQKITQDIAAMGIEAQILPVSEMIDPLLGEKDLLDIWRRLRNPELFISLLERVINRPTTLHSHRLSLNDILLKPIPEEDWLIEGVWTAGSVGLMIGSPKMGKSFLAIDMALSVASGAPFLDTFPVINPGPVVIVSKEDTEAALQSRLRRIAEHKGLIPRSIEGSKTNFTLRMSIGSELPLFVDLSQDFVFDSVRTARLLSWLAEIEEKYGKIALIIIDPVLKSLPEGIDEYKASQVNSSVFLSATTVREKTGAAVCLIHHRGKGNADSRDSLGSIAFFASSESTLFISGNQRKDGEFISVEGVYKGSADQFWRYQLKVDDVEYQPLVERDHS